MGERWRLNRVKLRKAMLMAVLAFFLQNFSFCWSLNSEGLALLRFRERVVRDPFGALSNWNGNGGDTDPCSWFGVECTDGKVVVLNLKDLCLGGTLSPDLGKLAYIKSIVLRNNSLFGNIPKEIGELEDLEVLDLGYNNFSGPFPFDFGNNFSLTTLLLDNNKFLGDLSPELNKLRMLSELLVDKNQLNGAALEVSCNSRLTNYWNTAQPEDIAHRRQLLAKDPRSSHAKRAANNKKGSELSPTPSPSPFSLTPSPSPFSPSPSVSPLSPSPFSPSPSPLESPLSSPSASPSGIILPPSPSPSPVVAQTPASIAPLNPPVVINAPPPSHLAPLPSPASAPGQMASNSKHNILHIWAGILGGSLLVLILAIGILFFRSSKVVTVKPWATGLSGQLQKAFVTGVPKLNWSELEAACEDFSNIIGSFSDGTVYKGTLSSGVEIAVTSSSVTSREDWSKTLEAHFRKKIDTLSKVNHKNFVNLIGFCEEQKPFRRMMVFEYAPNGTLFEHLHIKEAEHLEWGTRLRIAMGMAYCLEHMHQLTPPIAHRNLQSSSVYLTEDYAAKLSDFSFWSDATAAKMGSASLKLLESPSADPKSNVYSFGVILFEMIMARMPYSVDNNSCLADWASDYLRDRQSLIEIVDPTLKSFQEDVLEEIVQVIRDCVNPDPKQRPRMKEITARLKEITELGPDGAMPKLSPLWWAELEIMSADTS